MKFELRPELGRVLRGVHSAGVQGLGRPLSNLVVQIPHEAPEGESLIPSLKVAETLTQVNLDLQQLNINLGQLDKDLDAANITLEGVNQELAAVDETLARVDGTLGDVSAKVDQAKVESAAAKEAADKAATDAASAVDKALAAQATADGFAVDIEAAREAASAAASKSDAAAAAAAAAQAAADAVAAGLPNLAGAWTAAWRSRGAGMTKNTDSFVSKGGATTSAQFGVAADKTDPVPVAPGRTYRFRAVVSADGDASVRLDFYTLKADGVTGGTRAQFAEVALTAGTSRRLIGGLASVASDVVSARPTVFAWGPGSVTVHSVTVEDVTEAVAAQKVADQAVADAKAAKSAADAAAATALAAQADADDALAKASTADGRYTVAAANPTAADGAGKPSGAVWEVRAGGVSLRRFVWDGTAWTQVKAGTEFIGDKAISRAQIGDAAVGTAQIADAAITNAKVGDLNAGKINAGTLDAARIGARSLSADKIIVGTQENLIPNGAGEFGTVGGWTAGALAWDAVEKPADLPGSFVCPKGSPSINMSTTTWDVEPSTEYLTELWIKADVPDSRLFVELRDNKSVHGTDSYAIPGLRSGGSTGDNSPGGYLINNQVVPTVWTKITNRTVTRAGVNKLRVGLVYYNHSNGTERNAQVWIAGFRMMKRATGELIVDGAITSRTLSAEAVTAGKIAAGAVQAGNIAANAVTANEIAANAVTSDEIAANAVTADELAANAVVAGKIAANAVTADTVAANAITGDKIVANSVNGDRIIGNTISGDKIVGNSITANQIASNAITADELSANSVNAAALQADAITAKHTITGATLQTAPSGARTVVDQSGMTVYNGSNQSLVQIGQGIDTGMAIRSPDGRMIPLSNVAFGSYSDYRDSTMSVPIYTYTKLTTSPWGHFFGTPAISMTPWSDKILLTIGGTIMMNWNDGTPADDFAGAAYVYYRPMINGYTVKLKDNSGAPKGDMEFWGTCAFISHPNRTTVSPVSGQVVVPVTPGNKVNIAMQVKWFGGNGVNQKQTMWLDFVSTWMTVQQL